MIAQFNGAIEIYYRLTPVVVTKHFSGSQTFGTITSFLAMII